MIQNIGKLDRIARFALGALLIVLAAAGIVGLWGYLGVIFVATATINFYPLYQLIGAKTCSDC